MLKITWIEIILFAIFIKLTMLGWLLEKIIDKIK